MKTPKKQEKKCEICHGTGFVWIDKEACEAGEKADYPCPSCGKQEKKKFVKAYVVIVDGEICHLQGQQLQVYSGKVLPNKYQKVVPCEIIFNQ